MCSCPITLHPVTANQGANNRRKGLIALDSAPTTGPIMATYWLPVLVQPLLCREIVWNFQHGLQRSEWGETAGIKSWIVGGRSWGRGGGDREPLTEYQSYNAKQKTVFAVFDCGVYIWNVIVKTKLILKHDFKMFANTLFVQTSLCCSWWNLVKPTRMVWYGSGFIKNSSSPPLVWTLFTVLLNE